MQAKGFVGSRAQDGRLILELTWDRRTVDAIHKRPRCREWDERVHVDSMAHAGAADVGCEKGARAEEGQPGVERACSVLR